MLWVIEVSGGLTVAVQADLDRMGANNAIAALLAHREISLSLRQANLAWAPLAPAGEDLLVLAHAGYEFENDGDDERSPWIGGQYLPAFAASMLAKFTAAGLNGRDIWFLVCHTGADLAELGRLLVAGGVTDARLYMPDDFMFVSTAGIPHLLPNRDDVDQANRDVARADADFYSVGGALETGMNWVGLAIVNSVAAPIGAQTTDDEVRARFDPSENECS